LVSSCPPTSFTHSLLPHPSGSGQSWKHDYRMLPATAACAAPRDSRKYRRRLDGLDPVTAARISPVWCHQARADGAYRFGFTPLHAADAKARGPKPTPPTDLDWSSRPNLVMEPINDCIYTKNSCELLRGGRIGRSLLEKVLLRQDLVQSFALDDAVVASWSSFSTSMSVMPLNPRPDWNRKLERYVRLHGAVVKIKHSKTSFFGGVCCAGTDWIPKGRECTLSESIGTYLCCLAIFKGFWKGDSRACTRNCSRTEALNNKKENRDRTKVPGGWRRESKTKLSHSGPRF